MSGKNSQLKRYSRRVYDFCERNGWVVSLTKKSHYKLHHPIAGFAFHGGTVGDDMAETACLTRLRRMMRQHNLEIKP